MWQYAIKRIIAFIPVFITVAAVISYLSWEHMNVIDAHLTKNATWEDRIDKQKQYGLIGNELFKVSVHMKLPASKRKQLSRKLAEYRKELHRIQGKLSADVAKKARWKKEEKAVSQKIKKIREFLEDDSFDFMKSYHKRVTLGSSSKSDIQLRGKGVRKIHASLHYVPTSYFLLKPEDGSQKKRMSYEQVLKKWAPAWQILKGKRSRKRRKFVKSTPFDRTFKGRLFLRVSSDSKVLVNRILVKGIKELRVGDVVQIGTHVLRLQLDRSMLYALLSRNFTKSWDTLRFRFGESLTKRKPVSDIIWDRAFVSLCLTLPALLLTTFLGVVIGLISAFFRGSWIDRSIILIAVVGMSISSLVYIIVLQNRLAFKLQLFPIYGFPDSFWERLPFLVLPILIQVVVSLGYNARFYRTVMVEESTKDYIITAYAKGVSKMKIIFVHMLRNAMIPIITRVFVSLPFLFLGSFLLEIFFGIPGLGSVMVMSLTGKTDPPIVIGVTTVLCSMYILCLIATDIAYAVADPRVRLN